MKKTVKKNVFFIHFFLGSFLKQGKKHFTLWLETYCQLHPLQLVKFALQHLSLIVMSCLA